MHVTVQSASRASAPPSLTERLPRRNDRQAINTSEIVVPERAGDLYAAVKLARQQRGLPLDENDLWVAATALALGATLVSRDNDFGGIDGLAVVAPR